MPRPQHTTQHDGPEAPTADGPSLEEATAAANTVALRLLTVRARSRAELADRLHRRGFPEPAVDAVIGRLQASGLLDDEAFAAAYASGRAHRGATGSILRRDLRARGVAPDVADRAAEQASPPEDEAERCHALADAWLARHPDLPTSTKARRLAGYLSRRGYPPPMVQRVTEALIGDPDSDPRTVPPQADA